MSSLMWYIYDFARKAWAQGFTNAKTSPEIVEKPSRFRNFPNIIKEYCIGCGACEHLCPSRPQSAIYVEGHEMHRMI